MLAADVLIPGEQGSKQAEDGISEVEFASLQADVLIPGEQGSKLLGKDARLKPRRSRRADSRRTRIETGQRQNHSDRTQCRRADSRRTRIETSFGRPLYSSC